METIILIVGILLLVTEIIKIVIMLSDKEEPEEYLEEDEKEIEML